jgi:hypothetical protein
MGSDYNRCPTPQTKIERRRSYTLALGHVLDADNTARYTKDKPEYWELHPAAVKHWGRWVALNVDEPIADGWCALLASTLT